MSGKRSLTAALGELLGDKTELYIEEGLKLQRSALGNLLVNGSSIGELPIETAGRLIKAAEAGTSALNMAKNPMIKIP
jgi:hypothetical protein